MNSFYIPSKFIFLFIFISILLFSFANFLWFLCWLIIFFFFVIAFRKIPVDYKDYLGMEKKIIYSPIHGRVIKIDEVNKRVILKMPWWGPFGVFFPARAEVMGTDERLVKKGIFTKLDFKAIFKLSENQEIAMKIESWYLLIGPRMWIVAGDRGRLAANMGMVPFGGKVFLTLPEGSKLKVKKGTRVRVGRSIIAGLKE